MNTHRNQAAQESTRRQPRPDPTADDLLLTVCTIRSTLAHLKCQVGQGGARTIGILSVLNRLCEIADTQADMLRSAFWMADQGNARAGVQQLLAHGALQGADLAAAYLALRRLVARAAQQEAKGSYLSHHLATTWPAALSHTTCSISAVNVEAVQLLAASCDDLDAETAAAQPELHASLEALREAMTTAVAELEAAAGERAATWTATDLDRRGL